MYTVAGITSRIIAGVASVLLVGEFAAVLAAIRPKASSAPMRYFFMVNGLRSVNVRVKKKRWKKRTKDECKTRIFTIARKTRIGQAKPDFTAIQKSPLRVEGACDARLVSVAGNHGGRTTI